MLLRDSNTNRHYKMTVMLLLVMTVKKRIVVRLVDKVIDTCDISKSFLSVILSSQ